MLSHAKFHIFDDPKQAKIIGSIPMGTAGFAENFQCVIVVVADLSAYPFEKDRHKYNAAMWDDVYM